MQPTDQLSDLRTDRTADQPTGFTLVEMLVVVLIVGVLIGITVKILGGAGRQAAKAITVNRMERLKHSIEEYYAEYGQYPPAQSVAYEYPSTNGNFVGEVADAFDYDMATNIASETIFSFGLMSFLLKRVNPSVQGVFDENGRGVFHGPQWHSDRNQFWDPPQDLPRALLAMQRWAPFLNGPPDQIWEEGFGPSYYARGDPAYPYTNMITTVRDGWGREFQYRCTAPYQTYKLWSFGADSNSYIFGHVGD